jgi:nicotinamide-nucleotide amidase
MDPASEARRLLEALGAAGGMAAFAESCTAEALTEIPGSSSCFWGGAVAYSNGAKASLLGVDPALIEAEGAVSGACALAMARGALEAGGAEFALAITGIAGPGGGSPDKPVGTVWIATGSRRLGLEARLLRLAGSRREIRERAAAEALGSLADHARRWKGERD